MDRPAHRAAPVPPTQLHQALLAKGYHVLDHHVAREDSRVVFWFYGAVWFE